MLLPNISVRAKARDVLRTVICSNCVDSAVDDGLNVESVVYPQVVYSESLHATRRTRKKTGDSSPVCVASLTFNNTTYRCGSIDELERIIRTRIPELHMKLCSHCPRPTTRHSTN